METVQRMLTVEGGKRAGLKLDGATWETIDRLATESGLSWREWCRSIIDDTPSGENITAAVRAAALDGLLMQLHAHERGPEMEAMHNHPLMRDSASLSDAELKDILKGATIQGKSDFLGFEVLFGHDEYGQDCVWIRNGLRNGHHFALVAPTGSNS
jgi:predicted DNA-binding ribbon-helix-helix protein